MCVLGSQRSEDLGRGRFAARLTLDQFEERRAVRTEARQSSQVCLFETHDVGVGDGWHHRSSVRERNPERRPHPFLELAMGPGETPLLGQRGDGIQRGPVRGTRLRGAPCP